MAEQADRVNVLRDEIRKIRAQHILREERPAALEQVTADLERVLAGDPIAVVGMLLEMQKDQPARLAQLLNLAAQQLTAGTVSSAELMSMATGFSQQPALLSRLLSGMGA